ncbi:MAG: spondin domain-containing protein [Candidatus Rokuibacteriota bacterium]
MKATAVALAALMTMGGLLMTKTAPAEDNGPRFEVTMTNLTRGQTFTPVLVASHREGVTLFTLGAPASAQLAILAEEGNTAPLAALLLATPGVRDVADSGPPPGGFVAPGQSKTVVVDAGRGADHISVAAMLIPTNDGFFALNGVRAPRGNELLTYFSPAYDSGSERNDELCASIPGPFFTECAGPGGGGKPAGGEGYVHIHAGIHGIGNLNASARDWRNPVAHISIRRIR